MSFWRLEDLFQPLPGKREAIQYPWNCRSQFRLKRGNCRQDLRPYDNLPLANQPSISIHLREKAGHHPSQGLLIPADKELGDGGAQLGRWPQGSHETVNNLHYSRLALQGGNFLRGIAAVTETINHNTGTELEWSGR